MAKSKVDKRTVGYTENERNFRHSNLFWTWWHWNRKNRKLTKGL